MIGARPWAKDAAWLAGTLLLVLAWDMAGGDRALSAWAGGAAGFPLRAPGSWASRLHDAGRVLAALGLVLLAGNALWPRRDAAHRWTLLATLLTLVAVPALKRLSATSCPWDVADFGGSVPYVPHLWWWLTDGGPGHCFPSGHAVGAFAFMVPALALRHRSPHAAGWALAAVMLLGMLFGAVQVMRGAHYWSHVLWSGWVCLALATVAERCRPAWARPSGVGAAAAGPRIDDNQVVRQPMT
jgi:membrane-associated PAP2 superfamily phosphatase